MPKFDKATSFTLHSIDHDQVLLDSEIHSTRRLLKEENEQLPKQMKLSFTLNGEERESLLTRERGAFSEDATVSVLNAEGEYEFKPVGDHFAYYSEDRNWVLTFHNDGKFDGLIYEDNNNKIHHFVVENGEMRVDGNVRSYFPGEMKSDRKLTTEVNGIDYWDDCHPAQSSGLSELRMGGAIGNVMYKNFGEDGALAEYSSYMTLSNTIYERQMDIRLSIVQTYIATNAFDASWAPGTCSQDIQTQLSNMRFWNPPSEQVLWHLIDDCFGFSGGILGIAYLGVLCSSNNVGVSYYSDDRYNINQYPTWATVAHEIGHNFDGQHSFEEGQGRTGGIMDYGYLSDKLINGEVQFNSKYREREVCREVSSAASRGCLNEGIAPSPTGQLTVPETAESEIFAEKERNLNCAKHTHRMPDTADHLRKFNQVSRLQCRKECAARENCVGFVYGREEWCELLSEVNADSLKYTSEFNTFLCVEGELPERFTRKSEDDVLAESNVAALKEECCVATEHESYLGMNTFYRENLTSEQCEVECIQNTRCEAVTFDPVHNACMFYGGPDFTHRLTGLTGASTLTCDRPCISAAAVVPESASSAGSQNIGAFVGAFALVAGLVGVVVGAVKWRKQRVADNETAITAGGDGAIYKATL